MGQFGNKISDKMRYIGWKATDVAAYLEITELQALKIATGTEIPTPKQVILLAQMFNLDMKELMEMAKREKIKESNIEIIRRYDNALHKYYGG